MTVTGGEALVAGLADHGVDTVFGIPGTHNLEIYRHLPDRGIRHIGVRHEQGAGYAADGYARTTGKVGVAVVTTGPAVTNIATAVAQAWSDSVPMLVVSPGMPLEHPATGNGLLHEARDQGAAMRAISAASLRATSVAEIPTAVAQAFAIIRSGRPRPVHLEVPLDVLLATGDAPAVPPMTPAPVTAAADVIRAAAERISRAERPAMIVGGGAKGAADQVAALAERLDAPVVTTTNGKGILPEDHPMALGGGIHLPTIRTVLEGSDVVVAIGTEFAPADLWYGPLPVDGKLVRIDIDPVGAVTNVTPEIAIISDAATALSQLLDALPPDTNQPDAPAVSQVAEWREAKTQDGRAEGADYIELIDAMAAALPRDAVVAADNAMACYYGAVANLPRYTPASFLFPTGFGTLGYGLPAAIGAAIGSPERPTVAMLGDGGVMFTIAEIAAAAVEKLPLPVIVVDNLGYGEIRDEMIGRDDPVHAVTFPSPDFAALGRSLGCRGVTITDPADVTGALRDALAADGPTLIHVRLSEGDR